MPKKEVIQVNLAAANPNLSPATRFGNLVSWPGKQGDTRFQGKSVNSFKEIEGRC